MMKRTLALLVACLWSVNAFAATGTISPSPFQLVLDSNGAPINQACVWTYLAGTSTLVSTYTDVNLSVANANPIIVPATGRYTAFLAPGTSYKFIYENPPCSSISHGSTILTADNISAMPSSSANLDVLGTAGDAITAGQVVYLSDGSGGKTPGSWYKGDATTAYSSTFPIIGVAPSAISALAVGSIRLAGTVSGLSALTVGATYFVSGTPGSITSTAPANRRVVGVADSTSSLVLVPAQPSISSTSTITTTGTSTALALPAGSGNLIIFANNATALTLQGISAANDGQQLTIYSIGAGQVDINDQNGGASAPNRIITGLSATLSLAAGQGRAALIYDATVGRWRVQTYAAGSANAIMEGLSFPATQVASSGANVLDDYEEGTWTPTDGSGAALSFTAVVAQYVKIGQLVIATATLTYPVTASGASATLATLPFNSNSSGTAIYGCSINYSTETTLRALNIQPNAATTLAYDTAGVLITNATMSTDVMRFTCIYRATQ